MRKRWLMLCLVVLGLFVVNLVMPSGDTRAYFADNPSKEENGKKVHKQCFTMQWLGKGESGDTTKKDEKKGQTGNINYVAFSTKWFCTYPDSKGRSKKIIVNNKAAIKGSTLVGSRADGSDGFTIAVTSNKKGIKAGKWEGKVQTDSKNFMLKDYNYDFKKLTDAVSDWLPNELRNTPVGVTTEKYTKNKQLTPGALDAMEAAAEEEKYGTSNNNDEEESGNCVGSGGAGALGWVVCPLLDWMAGTASDVYNRFVEPSLKIDPHLFSGGDDSMRKAWGSFQNIANIIFVILLLIVIISQLTGVGIDNYGIKRILPKLIVTAIMINLSYVVCLLLVDVSNIVGNSFQSLFKGLEDALGAIPQSMTIESTPIKTAMITGLTGVGLLGAIVAGGAAIIANPAILLSLLVSALGIVIAIFFLFILLSARQAAIIVLVVVSPIAIILYSLPNTKKVFDKWYKLFEGLLLVYPICGLLVGAGGYASKLVLIANANSGNSSFIGSFTAMMISIIPVFFIPTILRNSFSALGNIGARITGFGQRVSGGVTNMARGSQMYRNAQELGAERANRIRAGVDANGKAYDVGRLGTFMRGGRRNVARARSQYLSNQEARNREENLMGSGYDAAMAGIEDRANQQKIAEFEASMASGKVIGADGKPVNTNDPSSVSTFHANALGAYNNAKTDAERKVAMTQVQAAQNMLMKTTAGRDNMQNNLEAYARASQAPGLSEDERKTREEGLKKASSHIMGQYGDKLKATNRGSHAMIQDMASGASMSDVVNKINDSTYDMTGTSKYTSETLAAADDGAVDRIINNMGNMSPEQAADIQSSASNALRQEAAGEISLKPEMRRKMQAIVGATVRSGPPAP